MSDRHCSTPGCGYNNVSQQAEQSTLLSVLKSMRRREILQDPCHYHHEEGKCTPVAFMTRSLGADKWLQVSEVYRNNAQGKAEDEAQMDVDEEDTNEDAEHDGEEDTEEDVEEDIEKDVEEDAEEATNNPIDWRTAPNLPRFNTQTVHRIEALLDQIDVEVEESGRGSNWLPAEDSLLLFLRTFSLSYARIYQVSPLFFAVNDWHAPTKGCESRRAALKKQGR